MKLVQVIKDTRMFVSGYEHRTWQCSVCPAVERRMTLAGENAPTMQSDIQSDSTKPTSIPEQTRLRPRDAHNSIATGKASVSGMRYPIAAE
jgi:hypothetical protein